MRSPLFSRSLYTEVGRGDAFSVVFPFFVYRSGREMRSPLFSRSLYTEVGREMRSPLFSRSLYTEVGREMRSPLFSLSLYTEMRWRGAFSPFSRSLYSGTGRCVLRCFPILCIQKGGRGDTFSFVFPFFYTEVGHGMYGHVLLLMFFLAGQEKSFKQWLPH